MGGTHSNLMGHTLTSKSKRSNSKKVITMPLKELVDADTQFVLNRPYIEEGPNTLYGPYVKYRQHLYIFDGDVKDTDERKDNSNGINYLLLENKWWKKFEKIEDPEEEVLIIPDHLRGGRTKRRRTKRRATRKKKANRKK
jgi:hypothetical protein